eukprot:scaffold6.g2577.t1
MAARAPPNEPRQPPKQQQALAAGLAGAAAALLLAASPASAREPFLRATGAKGPLAAEEEQLFRLRQKKETEALTQLEDFKVAAEEEVRTQRSAMASDQLCVTPFGVDVVGITGEAAAPGFGERDSQGEGEFVALTGALVGGISARRRKQELERLNEQLRTINAQLRQQARAGTLYAPGLTYAPPMLGRGDGNGEPEGGSGGGAYAAATAALARPPLPPKFAWPEPSPAAQEAAEAAAAAVARAAGAGAASPVGISVISIDEDDMRPEAKQCLQVRERRAMRGLAACARLQGQYRQAIKHLERVLEISNEIGDHVGDADAYGTIADIYTDQGDLEKARGGCEPGAGAAASGVRPSSSALSPPPTAFADRAC